MKYKLTDLILILKNYDTITFDMFDTLVSRNLYSPNDVFHMLSKFAGKEFNIPENLFYKLWKRANREKNSYERKVDISYIDIYKKIEKFNVLSHDQLEKIYKTQLDIERKNIIPRNDVLKLFNSLIGIGKKIYIISDTGYSEKFLTEILNTCGYHGFKKIITSNESKSKKIDGKLWKLFFKNEPQLGKTIHIGDNPLSDKFWLDLIDKESIRIYSSKSLSRKTHLFKRPHNWHSKIYQSIINNKVFNSPFVYQTNITNCYDFGYAILAPIFLHFFNWLTNNVHDGNLIFLSRDGYYLQKIYNSYIKFATSKKLLPNNYVYSSRQATIYALINDEEKIVSLIRKYKSNLDIPSFIKERFNIDISEEDKVQYKNCRDKKILIYLCKKYENEILQEILLSRNQYKNYLLKYITKDSTIVDLGYKGTIQMNIGKITGIKIKGKYLITAGHYKCKKAGYSIKGIFPFKGLGIIPYLFPFRYIFEPFLTSPEGQFFCIDRNGKFIFKNDTLNNEQISLHEKVFKGIIDFFENLSNYICNDISFIDVDIKHSYKHLLKFYRKAKCGDISDELCKLFVFNDPLYAIENKKAFKNN